MNSSSQVTSGATYAMSYLHDLAGELTSFTFPSGRIQGIGFDNGGRANCVTNGALSPGAACNSVPDYASSFAYFANGALANVSLGPNSLIQQYCQNSLLQIVGVRLGPVGGSTTSPTLNGPCPNSNPTNFAQGDILNLALTWGSSGQDNGNLTAQTIANNDASSLNVEQQFAYDAYNRLMLAVETPTSSAPTVNANSTNSCPAGLSGNVWCQGYGYDAFGNRWVTNWTSGSYGYPMSTFTPTASSWYPAANRLTNAALPVQYDNGTTNGPGNLTAVGGFTYVYDAENRQTQSIINSVATNYSYDGEGRRVTKATGSANTTYVYL